MKTSGLCAAILWFAVAYPCTAQLMSASQYRDYMKGLDAAAARWQKQIKDIDVGKMNLDYSNGKMVDRARGAILENLRLMRGFIEQQHSLEVLSVDISIENAIGDASEQVSVLLDTLPSNQEGLSWMRTVADTNTEMADQAGATPKTHRRLRQQASIRGSALLEINEGPSFELGPSCSTL